MKSFKITLLVLPLLLSPLVTAKTLKELQASKSIRLSTEGTFPPFNFFKGADLTGFEVEVANAVVSELKLKPEWKTFNFDSLLIGLAQDRSDLVVSSHGITDERAKVVDFLDPHYCTGGVIVSKDGGPTSFDAIKTKKVVVQVGTTYLGWLEKNGLKTAKTFPKDTDALQNLLMGRADVWVTDKFVALDAIKANPKAKLVLGEMVFEEKIAMAVSKGNKELREALNKALATILKDGRYKALSEKYFGLDIRCK
jgi:polar amino acid transport system substrate-binding protein